MSVAPIFPSAVCNVMWRMRRGEITHHCCAQEIAPLVRILGCYPADTSNSTVPSPIVQTKAAEGVTEQLEADLQRSGQTSLNGFGFSSPLGVKGDSLLISAAANVRPIQQVVLAQCVHRRGYAEDHQVVLRP